MKLYTLTFALVLFIVGCSSNDDSQPMDDAGTTTGDGTAMDQAAVAHLTEAFGSLFLKEIDELENVISSVINSALNGDLQLIEGTQDSDLRTYSCKVAGTFERTIQIVAQSREVSFNANNCTGEEPVN